MTLRDNLSPEKRDAHRILDMVKAGHQVEDAAIGWALAILGDVE